MNSQYMKVNPNELVIDLPVDEAKVAELMESIKTYGLLQPPNIWLNGMRIIDGFHRVVACQRSGLTEIDCIITDCDEEAFWDARIIAAKPHSSISGERLAVWMLDSWKASKWYKLVDENKVKKERELLVFTPILTSDHDRLSLAEAIWGADSDEAVNWFEEKAKKWGVGIKQVLRVLGFGYLEKYMDQFTTEGEILAAVDDEIVLSATEASALVFQANHLKKNFDSPEDQKRIASEWILAARNGKKEPLSEIVQRRKKEQEAEERKKALRAKEEAHLRYFEYAKTPAGQAELHKQKLAMLDRDIDIVFKHVELFDITEFPESLRRLTSLISAIENKMEEAFPEHVKPTKVNPIIAENIELRRQLQEQQREIESLKRALESKQVSEQKFPSTAAIPGVLIETMQ